MDIENLTIKQARASLDGKEYSAVELAEAYLSRIEKYKHLNMYLEVFDDIKEQAIRADAMIASGNQRVLCGIPFSIKDNILIKGRRIGAASKILDGYHATYDATVIAKIKEEGGVFLGRTNMDEFAMGSSTENSAYGVVKNPHDESRVPGGSSGGSAVTVASHSALVSLGSDTGGSVRQPAGFCGVVGLKPTYGAVSRFGLIALGSSLDQIGPITKSVGDAEIVFNSIKGNDVHDSTSLPDSLHVDNKGEVKRIGVARSLFEGVDEDVLSNFEDTLTTLTTKGYEIVDIELPYATYALAMYYVILPAEISTNLTRFDGVRYGLHVSGKSTGDDYSLSRSEGFGPEARRRILLGTHILSAGYYDAYYTKAQAARQLITKDFREAFKSVDV
ncbi:Asp-tRNA(Asn)/Glu-tRNA(Gln) amidotransferase subunit GatA, partial [Candidatus Kaiserbacteria bacterium]|nr:Asp-tRNA(Asn)/Glu-tRNA(Gln) amidotransferase subunit GatA [Candidatus Kaiserbacteria bacterium]